jgi:hypothetical protein
MFLEPYDAYLGYLLELTMNLKQFDPILEARLKDYSLFAGGSSSNRWTLWVSKDIRQLFDQQKNILAPLKTHGAFVELLLTNKQLLESRNMLPPFVYTKKSYQDNRSEISQRQELSTSIQTNFPILSPVSPVTPHFQFPQFNHFNSQITLSSEMGSTADMFQEPLLTHSMDSLGNGFHEHYPNNVSVETIPQSNLEPLLFGHHVQYDAVKASGYHYGTAQQQRLNTPRIITNLNMELDALNLWTPVSPNHELPSPDVLKATDLASINATTNFGETFVLNEMEHYFNFNYGQ